MIQMVIINYQKSIVAFVVINELDWWVLLIMDA
jgi:hypothetical protein